MILAQWMIQLLVSLYIFFLIIIASRFERCSCMYVLSFSGVLVFYNGLYLTYLSDSYTDCVGQQFSKHYESKTIYWLEKKLIKWSYGSASDWRLKNFSPLTLNEVTLNVSQARWVAIGPQQYSTNGSSRLKG